MSTPELKISTKGWSLKGLLDEYDNFYPVDRISAAASNLQETLKEHEETGIPLVVEGFHELSGWPTDLFSLNGFCEYSESKGVLFCLPTVRLLKPSPKQRSAYGIFTHAETR